MRISDWSLDVCSSDLRLPRCRCGGDVAAGEDVFADPGVAGAGWREATDRVDQRGAIGLEQVVDAPEVGRILGAADVFEHRSEEHTSELQSLMRISYAVFCLKKKIRK